MTLPKPWGGKGGHEVHEFLADVDDVNGQSVSAHPSGDTFGTPEKRADKMQSQDLVPKTLDQFAGKNAIQAAGKKGQGIILFIHAQAA